jgi:thioredoxin 1
MSNSNEGEPEELTEIREQKKASLKEDLEDPDSHDEPLYVDGEAEFDEIVSDHEVVLVDFYADWCGPCQMLEPIVETIAADTDAAVAKVDIEANQGLAQRFGVRSIPTLSLFVDGHATEQLVGMQDESRLRSLVERHT